MLVACLQIDIEGYELEPAGLRDWLDSGALRNVQQIALEVHHYNEQM